MELQGKFWMEEFDCLEEENLWEHFQFSEMIVAMLGVQPRELFEALMESHKLKMETEQSEG